jgi:hypothetical protein
MAPVIERVPQEGLERFREIDRSNEIAAPYRQVGTELVCTSVRDSIPNFFAEGGH